MENINTLQNVFLNVRKSYRLLFEYQSKLLNLTKYIGDYFSYSFYGGFPLYSNPCPKRAKGNLDNWAWDWLNMYAYAFHFGSKLIGENNVFFEIRIYSDTGFYDSQEKKALNLETYNDVNISKTKIVLIASNLVWKPEELLSNFSSKISEYHIKNEENNICAKSYDLENFINEDETNKKLLDFIDYCVLNGIKIK